MKNTAGGLGGGEKDPYMLCARTPVTIQRSPFTPPRHQEPGLARLMGHPKGSIWAFFSFFF